MGNNNNNIDNCNITKAGGNIPVRAITCCGTSGKDNSNLTASSCDIYDFINPSLNSFGINNVNSTDCSIVDNSFFQTVPVSPTVVTNYTIISIGSGGGNHTVSRNYIN